MVSRVPGHLSPGWGRRWTARWKFGAAALACNSDLPSVPIAGSVPVRRFSWRTGQKHRPGLQFPLGTGRHHGFESLAERDALMVLEFAAAPTEVLSQPFALRFAAGDGRVLEHVPDFPVLTAEGRRLIDVPPVTLPRSAGGVDRCRR